MNTIRKITAIGLLASFAVSSTAGTFSVSPARIFMRPQERAAVINISNEGDEPVVLQAEVFSWSQQPDGKDVTTPTDDVFLSPPIMTLPPHTKQVLRVLRTKLTLLAEEQAYRFFLRELPEASAGKDTPGLQFALAYSLPIFVIPPNAWPKLDCRIGAVDGSKVRARCENTGKAHSQIQRLVLVDEKGAELASSAGAYILPSISHTFEFSVTGLPDAAKLKLNATQGDGSTESFEGIVGR